MLLCADPDDPDPVPVLGAVHAASSVTTGRVTAEAVTR
jgi:hypothetical protein